jgi:hypothetical protein
MEGWLDDRVRDVLVDPRDVVFPRLLARVVLQVLPLAIALYAAPTWLVGLAAVPYLAFVFARFGGSVMLALHTITTGPCSCGGTGGSTACSPTACPRCGGCRRSRTAPTT